MDILELKSVNSKMMDSTSSIQITSSLKEKRRPIKESFCEFDIMENYNQQRKHRKKSRTDPRQTDLGMKIHDLKARNEEIEKMYNVEKTPKKNHKSRTLSRKRSSDSYRSEKELTEQINKVTEIKQHLEQELLTRRNKPHTVKLVDPICQNCSGHVDKNLEEEEKLHRRHRRKSKKRPKHFIEEMQYFNERNAQICEEIRLVDIKTPEVVTNDDLMRYCLKGAKVEQSRGGSSGRKNFGKEEVVRKSVKIDEKDEVIGPLRNLNKPDIVKGVRIEEELPKVEHVSRRKGENLQVENVKFKNVNKEEGVKFAENVVDNDEILKLNNDIRKSLKSEDKEEIMKIENGMRRSLTRQEREELISLGKNVPARHKVSIIKTQIRDDKIYVETEDEERVNIERILRKNEGKQVEAIRRASKERKRSLSSNKEHHEARDRTRSLSRNRYLDETSSRDKQIEFDEVLVRDVEDLEVRKSLPIVENSSGEANRENLKINRKELSFSKLNLVPVKNLYLQETFCVTTQTSSINVDLDKKDSFYLFRPEAVESHKKEENHAEVCDAKGKISQTALALRDIFRATELEQIASIANKKPERRNYSEIINKQEICEMKCRSPFFKSKFHTSKTVVPTERIVEISSKIFRDQKISFTVEGIEPAKKFSLNPDGTGVLRKNLNLNVKVFPGVDVKESDMQMLSHGKSAIVETEKKIESLLEKKPEANSQISLKLRRYRMVRRLEQSLKKRKTKGSKSGKFVETSTQTILEDVGVDTVDLFDTLFMKDLKYDQTDSITQTSSKKSIAVEANLKINSSTTVCPKIDCPFCEKTKCQKDQGLANRHSKSESNIKFCDNLKTYDIYNFQIQNSKSVSSLGMNNHPKTKADFVSRIPKLKRDFEPTKKEIVKSKSELSDKISLNKAYHTNEIIALEKCLNDILAKLCSTDTVSNEKKAETATDPKIKVLHQKKRKSKSLMRRKSHLSINKIKRSKSTLSMHKGKKLRKKRCRKTSGEISESSNYISSILNSQSDTALKSVYKNVKSISSSTTILTKTSMQSCQKASIASLDNQIKNKKNLKLSLSKKSRIDKRRSKDFFRDFKKVFKSKQMCTSIDSLRDQYFPSVLLLSVSSSSVPFKRYKGVSSKVTIKSDKGIISKEPFYMRSESRCSQAKKQSVDSLEPHQAPDICPLTNIFNYSPPSYAYFVYNTEIQYKKNKVSENKSDNVTGRNLTSFSTARDNANNSIFFHEVKAKTSPRFVDKKLSAPKLKLKEELCTFSQVNECKTCKNLVVNFSPTHETKPKTAPIETCLNYTGKSVSNCPSSDSTATYKHLMSNESGYESCKSQKTNSIKNFFKKGGSLLDIFKTAKKKEPSSKSSLKIIQENKNTLNVLDNETSLDCLNTGGSRTVLWFNFGKRKKELQDLAKKMNIYDKKEWWEECGVVDCDDVCNPAKPVHKNATCQCDAAFEQQSPCHQYAEKVLMESAMRKEGYLKQYIDFKEIPLAVLLGKKRPKMSKHACKTAKCDCETSPCKEQENQTSSSINSTSNLPDSFDQDSLESTKELLRRKEESVQLPKSDSNKIILDHGSESIKLAQNSTTSSKLTDREVFDKLLDNYEKSDSIARNLSMDEEFIEEQLSAARSSISFTNDNLLSKPSQDDQMIVRDPRFSDKSPITLKKDDCTVEADDIGTCFARGFRPDNLLLSGDACFNLNKQDKIRMSPHMLKNTESIIDFSERETPLDFLLALGFMVDEASNALKDEDIRSRLLAAITEARVWINKITTTQGTLLYLVAYKARPETMRYFLQLVEAIINNRINNAIKLDGFLRVLEQVEDGRLQMINILGEDKFEEEENEEKIVKNQLKHLFVNVYSVAEKEAMDRDKKLTKVQINLLRILVAKYRAGLHPHLELIARYIGQGLLYSEVQLEAAMIFLSRLDTAEVKLKEFENYCGIRCEGGKGLRMENSK